MTNSTSEQRGLPKRVPGFSTAALSEAERHVRSSLDREVGGVLVGTAENGSAEIRAVIPALAAVGERAQVTFTHEVWDEVLARVERDYADQRIVGWYHSHPGFGIFLSEYDLFIHRNFFSDPAMVALVLDPRSGEYGWFGWVDGDISQIGETERTKDPASKLPARGPRRREVAERILTAAAAVLVGLVVGYLVWDDSADVSTTNEDVLQQQFNQAQQDLSDADETIARLEQQLAEEQADTEADGTFDEYTVASGETLSVLAERFYGDGNAWPRILAANPSVIDSDAIEVGQVIRIPRGP